MFESYLVVQDQIEEIIELCTQEKYEKLATIKAEFDFTLKKLNTEKTKDKYEKQLQLKEQALAKCRQQCDAEKKEKINAANEDFEAKRKKHQESKELRMNESKGKFR